MYLILTWDNLHHLSKSVSISEAGDHPGTFTSVVTLMFKIGQMILNCKTHHLCEEHYH